MKKKLHFIFLFFLFSLTVCFSVAQDTSAVKSKNYRWGGVQLSTPYDFTPNNLQTINGLSNGALKDKSAFSFGVQTNYFGSKYILRLKTGVCNRTQTNHGIDTTAGIVDQYDEIIKQNMFYLSIGIGRVVKYRYINIYGGGEFSFVYYGEYSHETRRTLFQNGNSWNEGLDITSPGGFATGLGTFAGCDFLLLKKISIGMELSISCLYSKTGGYESLHNWATGFYNNNQTFITENSKEQIYISGLRPLINISYYF